jgi:ribosomal protein L37AE/L43A
MDLLEEHWSFWHTELGLPDPGRRTITYLKARDSNELAAAGCAAGSGGCTNGTKIVSISLFDKHELIHAYFGETMTPPVDLFTEGVAVALSCDAGTLVAPSPVPSWRDVLQPEQGSAESFSVYPLGGQLVSYLLEQFGANTFVAFYRAIGSLTDADMIAERFGATYGVSLDEAWAQATGATAVTCLYRWECSRPPIALDGAPHAGQLVCDRNLVPRTLQIPSDLNLTVSFRNAPSNMRLSSACGTSTARGDFFFYAAGDFVLVAALPAGGYLLNPGGAEVTATVLPQVAVGPNCADLVPYPVPITLPLVVSAPASGVVYARLHFSQPTNARLDGSGIEGIRSTTIWSCAACGDVPSSCPSAAFYSLTSVFEGDATWVMQADGTWIQAALFTPR